MVFVLRSVSIAADGVVSFMSAVDELQFFVIVQVGETCRSLKDLVCDWLSKVSHIPKLDFLIVASIVSHGHKIIVVSQPDQLWRLDTFVSWGRLDRSLLSWVKHLHCLTFVQCCQQTTIKVIMERSWFTCKLGRKDFLLRLDIPNFNHVILSTRCDVEIASWMPVKAAYFFTMSQIKIWLCDALG